MKTYRATFTTTDRDSRGEKLTVYDLESMATSYNQNYVVLTRDHDPRLPPLGRISSAEVVRQANGEHALDGEIEVWECNDTPSSIVGDGRSIPILKTPEHAFEVQYDTPALEHFGGQFLLELAQIANVDATPVYNLKRAVDPLMVLVIAAGAVAAKIAGGFFGALGKDLYDGLKSKLRSTKRSSGSEYLLVLRMATESEAGLVQVDIIVQNPSPEDVDWLFTTGLLQAEEVVKDELGRYVGARRIVVEARERNIELLYWLRADGVPSVMPTGPHQGILGSPISISAVRRDMFVKLERGEDSRPSGQVSQDSP